MSPFAPGTLAIAGLLLTRIGAALLIAPIYSAKPVPRTLRVAILALLTMTALPTLVAAGAGAPPRVSPATLLSESLIGFAIGLGAAVFVGAAEVAGDLLAIQSGLSGASTLDPFTDASTAVLADFMKLVVITLMLTMDGHILMVEALAASTHIIPIGADIAAREGLAALVATGGHLFAIGVQIAAPVTAAVLVSNIAMGVLARTAPQLQVFMLAYPLQIVVGLFTLAMSLPLIATLFTDWPGQYRGLVGQLLETLGGR
ncbi:MAG: flagellar biosynthetic protein FliR [Longimicrobiales bacterium]